MEYKTALRLFHSHLSPRTYLEIGVQDGAALALADCDAVGIDPGPTPEASAVLTGRRRIYVGTSDVFFETEDVSEIFGSGGIDFAFIDGMHLFEFVLRDFTNIEKNANFFTVVTIHDLIPAETSWEGRQRQQPCWVGDVWKIIPILRKYRPDLRIQILDCPPSGLGVVTGLDPGSSVLPDRYDEIYREFLELPFPGIDELKHSFQPIAATESFFRRFARGGKPASGRLSADFRAIVPVSVPTLLQGGDCPGGRARALDRKPGGAYELRPAVLAVGGSEDSTYPRARAVVGEQKEVTADEVHLVELSDATVISQAGLIRLGPDAVVAESLWDVMGEPVWLTRLSGGRARLRKNKWLGEQQGLYLLAQEPDVTIDEPCFLAKKRWCYNYGHWIIEVLPRVIWALDNGYDGKFVVGRMMDWPPGLPLWRSMIEAFRVLGVNEERLLPVRDADVGLFRRLAFAAPLCKNPVWIHPATRQLLKSFVERCAVEPRGERRIFIMRGQRKGRRNCLNEGELAEVARKYGFLPVVPDELSFLDQIRLVQNAEFIIATHGSGVANCAFAPEDTRILMLNSVIFPDKLFHCLFGLMGNRYGVVFGLPQGERMPFSSDFSINPELFEGAIRDML